MDMGNLWKKRPVLRGLIALVTASSFFLSIFTAEILALAPELRSKPFSEATRIDFENTTKIMCAAARLRDLVCTKSLRKSHIVLVNKELFPDGNVEIGTDLRQGSLSTGRPYSYVVFTLKHEKRVIEARFINDDETLSEQELTELGVRTPEDRKHLASAEYPVLKGVWFVDPLKTRPVAAVLAATVPGGDLNVAATQASLVPSEVKTISEPDSGQSPAPAGVPSVKKASPAQMLTIGAATVILGIAGGLLIAGVTREDIQRYIRTPIQVKHFMEDPTVRSDVIDYYETKDDAIFVAMSEPGNPTHVIADRAVPIYTYGAKSCAILIIDSPELKKHMLMHLSITCSPKEIGQWIVEAFGGKDGRTPDLSSADVYIGQGYNPASGRSIFNPVEEGTIKNIFTALNDLKARRGMKIPEKMHYIPRNGTQETGSAILIREGKVYRPYGTMRMTVDPAAKAARPGAAFLLAGFALTQVYAASSLPIAHMIGASMMAVGVAVLIWNGVRHLKAKRARHAAREEIRQQAGGGRAGQRAIEKAERKAAKAAAPTSDVRRLIPSTIVSMIFLSTGIALMNKAARDDREVISDGHGTYTGEVNGPVTRKPAIFTDEMKSRVSLFFTYHAIREDFDALSADFVRVIDNARAKGRKVIYVDEAGVPVTPPQNNDGKSPSHDAWLWEIDNNPGNVRAWMNARIRDDQELLDEAKEKGGVPADLIGFFAGYSRALLGALAANRQKIDTMSTTVFPLSAYRLSVEEAKHKRSATGLFFSGRCDEAVAEMKMAMRTRRLAIRERDDAIAEQIAGILETDPTAHVVTIMGMSHSEWAARYGIRPEYAAASADAYGYEKIGDEDPDKVPGGEAHGERINDTILREFAGRAVEAYLFYKGVEMKVAVRMGKAISDRLTIEEIRAISKSMGDAGARDLNDYKRGLLVKEWLFRRGLLREDETDLLFEVQRPKVPDDRGERAEIDGAMSESPVGFASHGPNSRFDKTITVGDVTFKGLDGSIDEMDRFMRRDLKRFARKLAEVDKEGVLKAVEIKKLLGSYDGGFVGLDTFEDLPAETDSLLNPRSASFESDSRFFAIASYAVWVDTGERGARGERLGVPVFVKRGNRRDGSKLSGPAQPARSEALADAVAEANRINAENLKLTPVIADKTILCHIITQSILPDCQKDSLNRIESELRKEKYREKVAVLSVKDPENADEFMAALEEVKRRGWIQEYRDRGYTVEFDVACPRKELVGRIQRQGMRALAFAAEGDGAFAQPENIIAALRALRTLSIDALIDAYKRITGKDCRMSSTDIMELARSLLFTLPLKADINAIGTLNRLTEENIASAA